MATDKNTIKLKKYFDVKNERDAASSITPGMIVEITSANKVKPHATSQGNVTPKMVAIEDELQGNGIEDKYSSGDKVNLWTLLPGEEFYGILADGEDVSIGDALASNGDGMLKKHVAETESWGASEAGEVTVYPNAIVGIAMESLTLSGSSGAEESSGVLGYDKRIKVMVV